MSKEIHSQNSNSDSVTEECLNAYRQAAEYDDYMFGNLDYLESWIGISTETTIDREVT
jgi:hypothetical protein